MKKIIIITVIIILISFLIGIILSPQMPDQMASHWNSEGEVDGYLSKFWGLFLLPLITLGIFLLLILIPRIDPLKENIEKFRKYYHGFIFIIVLFFFYIYLFTILWNLGIRLNIGQTLAPAFAVLFFYIGILLEKAKKNWFIGIRTPWTLSSTNVWEKTHKIGGKLFKGVGIIILLGMFFKDFIIYFILVPIVLATIYTVVYSYLEYRKEKKLKHH